MELEEMKSLWQNLSVKVEQQETIQRELLLEITKAKFKRKIDGIHIPEIFGTVISFAYAAYLVYNFGRIDLWYNQIFAVTNIFFFIILPVASLTTICQLKSLQINHLATTDMLEQFRRAKRNFWRVQQSAVWLAGLMVLTLIPILDDIQGQADKSLRSEFWMIYMAAGLVFLFFFSRYVLGKYRRIMQQSEDILQDI